MGKWLSWWLERVVEIKTVAMCASKQWPCFVLIDGRAAFTDLR